MRGLAFLVLTLLVASADGFLAPFTSLRFGGQTASAPSLRSASFKKAVHAAPKKQLQGSWAASLAASSAVSASMTAAKPSTHERSPRNMVGDMVKDLLCKIEGVLEEELELEHLELDEDLHRVAGEVDGALCLIDNTVWQTKSFRKVHIEVASFLDRKGEASGLDILHCVLFPRFEVVGPRVPIFGCDVVAVRGVASAAIVDLAPVTKEKRLPKNYVDAFDEGTEGLTSFSEPREIPEFGSHIFGDRCVFVRPADKGECDQFNLLTEKVLQIHCRQTALVTEGYEPSAEEVEEAWEGQTFYCEKQSQNDKTRKILEGSFGVEWTERYMSTLLFDKPAKPTD